MFHMSMGVFEHIGRGVVVYAFLFFLLRFAGKKHVGQLAPFDLVVLLILSETVQNSLIGDDTSLVGVPISLRRNRSAKVSLRQCACHNPDHGSSSAGPHSKGTPS